jgi:hypothetical protein
MESLEEWCTSQYTIRLQSAMAQELFEIARAGGLENERLIWLFHVHNWPTIVREAADFMGPQHAHATVHRLTDTGVGKEIEIRAMRAAFRQAGYDSSTINAAIGRSSAGELDASSSPDMIDPHARIRTGTPNLGRVARPDRLFAPAELVPLIPTMPGGNGFVASDGETIEWTDLLDGSQHTFVVGHR